MEVNMKTIKITLVFSMAIILLLCGCDNSHSAQESTLATSDSVSSEKESNIDENFEEPPGNTALTEISSEQLTKIPKNTSYEEIFNIIGQGADFYNGELALYKLDKEKILALNFKAKEEICPYSGEELALQAVLPKTENKLPLNADEEKMNIYGIVVYREPFTAVYSPITGMYYEVGFSESEIKFSDGKSASAEDIGLYEELIISCDEVLESFPPQLFNGDVTILK
jgi:hypothetical protein